MDRSPATTARYLLALYTVGEFALTILPAIEALRAGITDLLVWSIPVTMWIVAPAGVAALLVIRAKSKCRAWLFLAAEVAVIASTAVLCALIFANRSPQNAQAVVGLMILPFVQILVLASFTATVFGAALMLRGRGPAQS